MFGDPFELFQSINKAQGSAELARPKEYQLLDKLAQFYDEMSNSSSLSPYSAMTEVKHLDLAEKMGKGVLQGIQDSVEQVLISGAMMKHFAGSGGPIAAKARQEAQQKQIEQLIKSKVALVEQRMQMLARVMYENALADEQTRQLAKLEGSDMASSKGYSEEKINAMNDIAYTVSMDPQDLELNA